MPRVTSRRYIGSTRGVCFDGWDDMVRGSLDYGVGGKVLENGFLRKETEEAGARSLGGRGRGV